MSTYRAELHRSPAISDEEVRRRLAAAYRLLLDLAAQSKRGAPAESDRIGADASDGESVADRRAQSTPELTSAQVQQV